MPKASKTIKFEIEIDLEPNKISDEALIRNAAYVLGVYLESYCAYTGAPKIDHIRTYMDGKLIEDEDSRHSRDW